MHVSSTQALSYLLQRRMDQWMLSLNCCECMIATPTTCASAMMRESWLEKNLKKEKAASDDVYVSSEAVVVSFIRQSEWTSHVNGGKWYTWDNLTSNQCANNGFIASSRCDIQKRYKSSQNDNKHQQPRVILVFPVKVESCPSCQKPKTVRCVNSSSTTVSTNDERIP